MSQYIKQEEEKLPSEKDPQFSTPYANIQYRVLLSYFIINKIVKFYDEPSRTHKVCRFTFSAMIKTMTRWTIVQTSKEIDIYLNKIKQKILSWFLLIKYPSPKAQ